MLSKMICWRKCHLLSTEHEGDFLLTWNCSGKVVCPSNIDTGGEPIFYANYIEKLKKGNGERSWVQDIKEDPPKWCFYRDYHTGKIKEPCWFSMLVDLETNRVTGVSPRGVLESGEYGEGFFINGYDYKIIIYNVFTYDPIDEASIVERLRRLAKGKKKFRWYTVNGGR